MNLFGSREQKAEKDYQYLAEVLKTSNMDTEEKIHDHLKKVNSRALNATLLVVFIIGSLCLLWEKYFPIWGITGIMCFAWIWRSALVARKIMHRYIDEEINNPDKKNSSQATEEKTAEQEIDKIEKDESEKDSPKS